eukprot:13986183-Ditylum_brightwellii.AAC.1
MGWAYVPPVKTVATPRFLRGWFVMDDYFCSVGRKGCAVEVECPVHLCLSGQTWVQTRRSEEV